MINGNYDEKARNNAVAIGHEIERLQDLYSHHQYKEFWGLTRDITEMFRARRPLYKEDNKQLWARYSDICGTARQEMEKKREEQKDNASRIGQ